MKKRILHGTVVLSLIGTGTTVHAQSSGSVTLYGLLDTGISYISNEGGHSNIKFDDGILVPNLLGLRGTEDLGGGLHAIFNLVDQFIVGNGSIIPWQGLFGRNAYVGIASDRFGTLTFGNQYDFMVDSLLGKGNDPADNFGLYGFRTGPFSKIAIPNDPPFAGSFDWDRMAGGHPVNSSVKYQSVDFAGFSFGALYGFGGVPGSFSSGNSISAGINYDRGPFGIGAAYTEIKYFTAGQPQVGIRNWGVGAHYRFDKLTLTALVTTVRNTFNGGAIIEGQFGVAYQFAPEWITSAGYMYMKGNQFLDNNHAHQLGASFDYVLSKRTIVYAETVYQRTNSGAQALISGVLDPSGASSGPNQLIARIGLKTSF
ncbi:Porin, Gram-negative type [Paraburkholderia piptadeniae]|uniref:Porin, Gram-negative type n=1 Tax=Paraburkholderia piptadeniae TaxID=1701573 RepID=A0A1N7S9Q0_9BURK|nr:porin [Paraburkholderia piptadeniae]SIT44114.1 Porin, Gram-negative type [Paraburkholderia piptadeniae]